MSSSKDDPKPHEKIVVQYKKWLRLLQQIGNGLLPPHSQKGLIGELLYLAELIDKHGEDAALSKWVGPEGADQDFYFEKGWAEVKTTIIAGTSIQVSSLQQFDRADDLCASRNDIRISLGYRKSVPGEGGSKGL